MESLTAFSQWQPTLFGESVVLRILDRTVVNLDLNKIGMAEDILALWRVVIEKPNGIILVTAVSSRFARRAGKSDC